MIDYEVLKVLWWMILGSILVAYATTAGFDAGITTIMPFFKNEDDRRVILNVSAPTWDGNLTWILFAGGGLFVVWPVVYSTAFSGLYFAMLLILFPLFFRPPGYEYRNKMPSMRWKRFWDFGLFISGVMPVFMFGVATGNCFVGFPFHFDPISLRMFWTGSFWELLNPISILAGFVSVVMVIMHGSTYLQRRTVGNIRNSARQVTYWSGSVLLVLFAISGVLIVLYTPGYSLVYSPPVATTNVLDNIVTQAEGGWFVSFFQYPWKFFPPIFAFIGVLVSMAATYVKSKDVAFWGSGLAVAAIIVTSGTTLFPFIMPSSTNLNQSLTVWNSVSSQYALNTMLYIGVFMLAIVTAYKIFAYRAIWRKQKVLRVEDIQNNTHTYY